MSGMFPFTANQMTPMITTQPGSYGMLYQPLGFINSVPPSNNIYTTQRLGPFIPSQNQVQTQSQTILQPSQLSRGGKVSGNTVGGKSGLNSNATPSTLMPGSGMGNNGSNSLTGGSSHNSKSAGAEIMNPISSSVPIVINHISAPPVPPAGKPSTSTGPANTATSPSPSTSSSSATGSVSTGSTSTSSTGSSLTGSVAGNVVNDNMRPSQTSHQGKTHKMHENPVLSAGSSTPLQSQVTGTNTTAAPATTNTTTTGTSPIFNPFSQQNHATYFINPFPGIGGLSQSESQLQQGQFFIPPYYYLPPGLQGAGTVPTVTGIGSGLNAPGYAVQGTGFHNNSSTVNPTPVGYVDLITQQQQQQQQQQQGQFLQAQMPSIQSVQGQQTGGKYGHYPAYMAY